MVNITILGNESYDSIKLENICYSLVRKNQYQADVQIISEANRIDINYRNSLPVLIINDKVFSVGNVPSSDKIESWIDKILKEYFY